MISSDEFAAMKAIDLPLGPGIADPTGIAAVIETAAEAVSPPISPAVGETV